MIGFGLVWLAANAVDLVARSHLNPQRFAPVGIAAWPGVVSPAVITTAIAVVLALGLVAWAGYAYRIVAPMFALGLLWLLSYRNSWGHLSHSEHLLVLHTGIIALAPAADALTLRPGGSTPAADSDRYGWPLRLLMLVTATTYVIAGLAKVQAGGMAWLAGDSVRLHVATEVLRNDRMGAEAATLGRWLLAFPWVFGAMAVSTVVIELGAPLATLRPGKLRATWLGGVWSMHMGIWLVMGIGFPYPLSGVAFAAFLPLDRGLDAIATWWRSRASAAA